VTVPHVMGLFEGHNFITCIRTPWWWHSRSSETCRRLCIYWIHISVHASLVW